MIAAGVMEDLARAVAGNLVNGLTEGVFIAFFAWLLLRLAGRRNSSTRFAVWFAALLGIAVLPFLGRSSAGSMLASVRPAGGGRSGPDSGPGHGR